MNYVLVHHQVPLDTGRAISADVRAVLGSGTDLRTAELDSLHSEELRAYLHDNPPSFALEFDEGTHESLIRDASTLLKGMDPHASFVAVGIRRLRTAEVEAAMDTLVRRWEDRGVAIQVSW